MVTISKSSKLGRYYDLLHRVWSDGYWDCWHWRHLNLCVFMQQLIARTLLFIMVGAVILVVSAEMLSVPYWHILHGWVMPPGEFPLSFLAFSYYVGLMLWLLGAIAVITTLVVLKEDSIIGWFARRRTMRSLGEPGIFRLWLKAKKEKLCPIVNVVE